MLIGSHYSPWESQAVKDVNALGVRVYNHLHEIAQVLSGQYDRYCINERR